MKHKVCGAAKRLLVLLFLLAVLLGMMCPVLTVWAEEVQTPPAQLETDPVQPLSGDAAPEQPDITPDPGEPEDPDNSEKPQEPIPPNEPEELQNPVPPEEPEITPAEENASVSVVMQSRTPGCALPASDVIPVKVLALTADAPFTQHISSLACDRAVGTGTGNVTFGPFASEGTYRYAVSLGHSGLKDWVVEDSETHFIVEVTVTLNEEASALEAQMQSFAALQDEQGDYTVSGAAVSSLTAVKTYREPLSISVTKRWPDGGERPVIIKLKEVRRLTENGKTTKTEQEIGKVTLTKLCSWKHTFTANEVTGQLLHPDKEYVLDEVDMFKFSESYSYKKSDPLHWEVTVTNSEALYQTGPEMRPVFFLLCCGMMLMAAGAYLLRKQSAHG